MTYLEKIKHGEYRFSSGYSTLVMYPLERLAILDIEKESMFTPSDLRELAGLCTEMADKIESTVI